MEKSDKQTDVRHHETGVNPLQTLKSLKTMNWQVLVLPNKLTADGSPGLRLSARSSA